MRIVPRVGTLLESSSGFFIQKKKLLVFQTEVLPDRTHFSVSVTVDKLSELHHW